jgi:hypothetical protein
MLSVFRSARKAIKLWRSLPPGERDRYRAHVNRIQSLVAELGGQQAVGRVEDDDAAADTSSRRRAQIIAELRKETTALLAALAAPATDLAKYSVPRSARISGKVAGKGLRLAARRYSR